MTTLRLTAPLLIITAACSLPPLDGQAVDPANCPDGQIVNITTGQTFDNLSDALAMAHSQEHFCVGAGEIPATSSTLQRDARMFSPQEIVIEGAGSGNTTFVGGNSSDALIYIDLGGTLELRGVTFDGARVRLKARDLIVEDLEFTGYSGWERGLTLKGDRIDVDGLNIHDNQLDYASGLYLSSTEEAVVSGFVMRKNTAVAGYMAEFHGPLVWEDSIVIENRLSVETPGYDLVETYGPTVIDNVNFILNTFNGPALRAYDSLDASQLVISDNESKYDAVLSIGNEAMLTDSRILDNNGIDGAIGLYGAGEVTFLRVDLGEDRNAPCDISIESRCLDNPFDGRATGICDTGGCN